MEPKEKRTIHRTEEQSDGPSSSVHSCLFNIQYSIANRTRAVGGDGRERPPSNSSRQGGKRVLETR